MSNVIAELGNAIKRDDVPAFRAGDTIKVHVKVIEGSRSRVQVFQGVVIARQGSGLRETFKVRKISFGVGVERTYPINSPAIDRIEVVTRGDVRRAKLYYLRELRGKKAKIKEKRETGAAKSVVTATQDAAPVEDIAPATDPVLESNEPAAADVTGELTEA